MWVIVLSLIVIVSTAHPPKFNQIIRDKKRETGFLLKHTMNMKIEEPWEQLSTHEYHERTLEFLNNLRMNKSYRDFVQKSTVGQTENKKWFEARKDRVTASSFGRICTKTASDNSSEIIDHLINANYNHTSEGSLHGIKNELVAIQLYEIITGKKVQPCGVFIDTYNGFLAASPDGLIDDDGVLEVKCPFAAKDMTPYQAANLKKNFCLNDDMVLPKVHFYYYQIQGQLHITGRKYCDFVVWTPKGMHIHRIPRDDKFWRDIVEPKITQFYKKELLPELIKKKYELYNCEKDKSGLNTVECKGTVSQNVNGKQESLTVYKVIHNKFLNVKDVMIKMFEKLLNLTIN